MACGAGFYKLAVISALTAIVVLIGLAQLERPLERYRKKYEHPQPPDEQG